MKLWNIYTVEYYVVIQTDVIMQFAAAWMELEHIMLNEVVVKEFSFLYL